MAAGLPKQFKCVDKMKEITQQLITILFLQFIPQQPMRLTVQRVPTRHFIARSQKPQSFLYR